VKGQVSVKVNQGWGQI